MRDNDSRILRKTRDAFKNPGMLRDRRGKVSHDATLSRLSPYLTEHVNRFGKYALNLDRDSPTLDYTLDLRPGMEPTLATASV